MNQNHFFKGKKQLNIFLDVQVKKGYNYNQKKKIENISFEKQREITKHHSLNRA